MNQKEEAKKIEELYGYLGKNSLEQTKAFGNMLESIEKDGKVSAKVKEAVALGIAIKAQCKGCIAVHTRKALEKGYSPEEIIEIAWVAVLMGGGPSFVYMQYVKDAIEEFSGEINNG